MNSKLAAVGAAAFGVGAAFAWAFTADHFEGKMRRNQLILGDMLSRKEATIVSLEERVLARVPWPAVTDAMVSEAVSKPMGDDHVEDTDDEDAFVEEDFVTEVSEVQSNLQRLIDQYTANPNDQDEFVARAGRTMKFAKETPPFHIPMEVYAHDPDEGDDYAKITLRYFPRERILLDDDEDPIDDVDDYVGWRNLSRFGDESGDPDTVFVRNRRLLTDFEVVREEEDPPIHIRYQMSREEFRTNKAAGVIRSRETDRD